VTPSSLKRSRGCNLGGGGALVEEAMTGAERAFRSGVDNGKVQNRVGH